MIEKKVLIFDVDGTICESCQQITEEFAYLLDEIAEKYVIVFISGSTIDQIYLQISSLVAKEHHLMGSSGAEYSLIKEGGEKITKFTSKLPDKDKNTIISAFEDLIKEYNITSLTPKMI